MELLHRILPTDPIDSLDAYLAAGGGRAVATALDTSPDDIVAAVDRSGLRGRGGAGFPTGRKWRSVAELSARFPPGTVVVNGAEGEPGTLKDRTLLRRTPYSVLEGALVAARAIGADRVVVGVKASFAVESARLRGAIDEMVAAGWCDGVAVDVVAGPEAYLLGEETALLEVIDGRPPFPRIAPPYRDGVDEAPSLVDNAETLAHVTSILADGPEDFRSFGTADSPGTIVCTVTGAVAAPGVGELAMGTTLRDAIELVAGGPIEGRRIVAVLPGVSSALVAADQLDTPLTYEDMAGIGSGLGSAGYQVFDDLDDMVAVAAGASRFLYVESCGQCTPCKHDGAAISEMLDHLVAGDLGTEAERDAAVDEIRSKLTTIADGARCSLASQHRAVVASVLDQFGDQVAAHRDGRLPPTERALIAEVVDVRDGVTLIDERIRRRQPDWSDDDVDSGMSPVERLVASR